MLNTIPRQLSVSYLSLVLLCLLLAGAGVLGLVRSQTERRLTDDLLSESSFLSTLLARRDWPPELTEADRRLIAGAAIRLSLDSVVLVDARGRRLADSTMLRRPRPEGTSASAAPEIERALLGDSVADIRQVPPLDRMPSEAEAIDVLFTAVPVLRDGQVVGALAMRRPLADVELFMLTLVRALVVVAVVAGCLAWALGVWLARAFTRPLQRLGAAADRIADGHLDERIDVHAAVELERLGETFNRMAASLERQEATRSQFIGDASHELKTPLTSLRALIEAMQRGAGADPERAARFLELMHGEVDRLDLLVRDLLELHRYEAGAVTMEADAVSLQGLLRALAEQLGPSVPGGLAVEVAHDVVVRADEARLRQVLINLVDNASRAVQGVAAPRVTLAAERRGDVCTVRVEDNGPGIPADERERVFERFHRLDGGRTRREGGSGLGLAIARSIVHAHGGRIWIDEGAGGRVAFTLPAE